MRATIHSRKWTWSDAVAGTANRSTHISARAMAAIVDDVGALERLELVGALVLVDREPQREERVDDRLLAGQRRRPRA